MSNMPSLYLSQTNFDGTETMVSQTISLNRMSENTFTWMEVLPIPARDFVTVRFDAPTATTAKMTLYDAIGRVHLVSDFEAQTGRNELQLDIQKLTVGVYVVLLEMNGELQTVKMVVE